MIESVTPKEEKPAPPDQPDDRGSSQPSTEKRRPVKGAQQAAPVVKTTAYLTIAVDPEHLTCSAATKIPGGRRLHVTYNGGIAEGVAGSPTATLDGKVLSGADWVLLREDGVAVFEARLTLGTEQDKSKAEGNNAEEGMDGPPRAPDFLVNARVSGVVDLSGMVDSNTGKNLGGRQEILENWDHLDGTIPVCLPVTFEANRKVANWARPRFRRLAENYDEYSPLVFGQFLAVGNFVVQKGRIVSCKLKVVRVEPGDAEHG